MLCSLRTVLPWRTAKISPRYFIPQHRYGAQLGRRINNGAPQKLGYRPSAATVFCSPDQTDDQARMRRVKSLSQDQTPRIGDHHILLLATPAFAPALCDNSAQWLRTFMSHLYSNIPAQAPIKIKAAVAVVDALPKPSPLLEYGSKGGFDAQREAFSSAALADRGSAGFAYLFGDASLLELTPGASNHIEAGKHQPSFLSVSIPFQHGSGLEESKCHVHIPLATTVFVVGREAVSSVIEFERRVDGRSFEVTNAFETFSIKANWPFEKADYRNAGGNIALTVPLVPLTISRNIKDIYGNIIRQLSGLRNEDRVNLASSDIEAAVPAFFETINSPQSSVAVWALVGAKDRISHLAHLEYGKYLRKQWTFPKTMDVLQDLRTGARLHRVLSGGGGWGKRAGLISLDPDTGPSIETTAAAYTSNINDEVESSSMLRDVAKIGEEVRFFIYRPKSDISTQRDVSDSLRLWSLDIGTIPSSIDDIDTTALTVDASTERKEEVALHYVPNHFGALSEHGFYLELVKHSSPTGKRSSTRTKVDVPFSRLSVVQANFELDRKSASRQGKAVKKNGNTFSRSPQSLSSGIEKTPPMIEGLRSGLIEPSSETRSCLSIRKVYIKDDLGRRAQLFKKRQAKVESELNLLGNSTGTLERNVRSMALDLLRSLHYRNPFLRVYWSLRENRTGSAAVWRYLRLIIKAESTARAKYANPGSPKSVEETIQDLGLEVFILDVALRDAGWSLLTAVGQKMDYSFTRIDSVWHEKFYHDVERCLSRARQERLRRAKALDSVNQDASEHRRSREHIRRRRVIAPIQFRKVPSAPAIQNSAFNDSRAKPNVQADDELLIRKFVASPWRRIRKIQSTREVAPARYPDDESNTADPSVKDTTKDRRSRRHIEQRRGRKSHEQPERKLTVHKFVSTTAPIRKHGDFSLATQQPEDQPVDARKSPEGKREYIHGQAFTLLDELAEVSQSRTAPQPSSPELPQSLLDGLRTLLKDPSPPSSLHPMLHRLLFTHLWTHPSIAATLPTGNEWNLLRPYRSLLRNVIRAWLAMKAPRREDEAPIRKWLVTPAQPKLKIVHVRYGKTFRKQPLTFSKVRVSAPSTPVTKLGLMVDRRRRRRALRSRRVRTMPPEREGGRIKPTFRKYLSLHLWRTYKPIFRKPRGVVVRKHYSDGAWDSRAPRRRSSLYARHRERRFRIRRLQTSPPPPIRKVSKAGKPMALASDRDSFGRGDAPVDAEFGVTDELDARSAWEQMSERAASAKERSLMAHERSRELTRLREERQRLRGERRRQRARELVEQVNVLLEGVNGDEGAEMGEGLTQGGDAQPAGRNWDWSSANSDSLGPLPTLATATPTAGGKKGKAASGKELKEDVQGLLKGFNP